MARKIKLRDTILGCTRLELEHRRAHFLLATKIFSKERKYFYCFFSLLVDYSFNPFGRLEETWLVLHFAKNGKRNMQNTAVDISNQATTVA